LAKVISGLKRIIGRLRRRHPDVYDVLKKYCDEHGYSMADVVGSAVTAFLATDEKAKEELIERMGQRSSSGGVRATLGLFKEMCSAMGEMFKTMNEARAGMSMAAMLSDFKAVSKTLEEMKRSGAEAGKGSFEDLLATAFVSRLLGGMGAQATKAAKRSKGKVVEVEG